MFLRPRSQLPTFLLSYHVWVTSKIQVNFRFNRYSKVLMILSYRFSQFRHYLCFRGQRILFWHYWWATMLEKSRKSRSTSGSRGSQRYWSFCLMNFWNFFTIHVLRSRNPLLIFLPGYPIWVTSEKLGQLPVREILRGTDDCVLWNFAISSIYMFSMSGNHLLTFLLCYYVWGLLENSKQLLVLKVKFLRSPMKSSSCAEGCPGYSKLLKHGILVGIPAINSLTSKT